MMQCAVDEQEIAKTEDTTAQIRNESKKKRYVKVKCVALLLQKQLWHPPEQVL